MTRRCRPVQPPSPFNRFTRPVLHMHNPPRPKHTADELADLVTRSAGHHGEYDLIAQLRAAAPAHPVIVRLDEIAQSLGYVSAGSTEQMYPADEIGWRKAVLR